MLIEARMASTAQDARDMLNASLNHPELVCQVTPTSTTYKIDNLLKKLIANGYLGEVLSVEVQALRNQFANYGSDLHWCHDWKLSGYNTLNIGASYESMMRWLGCGDRVMAMSKVHVPYRANQARESVSVSIPDHVNILYELANGAQVYMRISATTGLSTGNQIWIYGTDGTIYVDQEQKVFVGQQGDSQLSEMNYPPEDQAYYRVEEQFTNAIRGTENVNMFHSRPVSITWSGRRRSYAAAKQDRLYPYLCDSLVCER